MDIFRHQLEEKWKMYRGMVMALSASFFSSIAFIIIKALESHGIQTFGAAVIQNAGILITSALAIIFNEFGPGNKHRERVAQGLWPLKYAVFGILIIQGILHGSSLIFRIYSLKFISVGDMTVIVFSSPILTTILAHFIVGEKCGIIFILTAAYTLIGVGLITKPPFLTGSSNFDTQTLIGSAFAVGALITLSLKFVMTRKIKNIHFLPVTFLLGFFGLMIALPLFLVFENLDSLRPTTTVGLLLRIALVVSVFCGAGSLNLALKMENAGIVALVRSFDVIFAFLLQYLLLGVSPDWLSGIGGFIVWSGVVIVGLRKLCQGSASTETYGQHPDES